MAVQPRSALKTLRAVAVALKNVIVASNGLSIQKQVDLFFIDGAHSYQYVRQDTLNAFQTCHQGNMIVWRDRANRREWRVEMDT